MILSPHLSHAYFQSKNRGNDFIKAGYQVNSKNSNNTFVLYDDFNPGRIVKSQILFPKSKNFISADVILIDFPLYVALNSYTTTENALGDQLYANLKMKKLIEEYKDIQARATELIWDSSHLFQQKYNTHSIYQTSKRLENYSIQTNKQQSGSSIFSTVRMSSNRSHFPTSTFHSSKRLRPNFTSSVNRNITNNNSATRYLNIDDKDEGKIYKEETEIFFFNSNETENYDDIEEKNQDERKLYKEENKINQTQFKKKSQRELSDPIIIKLISKLFNLIPYFSAHKGEAIFYGISLYFTLWFFSSIFKR